MKGSNKVCFAPDAYYRVPAAGGANGSIRDLVRWMAAQMGSNAQVLSADMLATLHRPLVPTPPRRRSGVMSEAVTDAAYGLGWRSFRYADHVLVGHGGSVDGYGSLVLFDVADRSGIVMLWNSNSRLPALLQFEFLDMLHGRPFTDWLARGRHPGPAHDTTALAAP
ncbi:MAG: serine hydrolase domain-containing protein [Sphingomonadaceae bacterium]